MSPEAESRFNIFWTSYPRKKGRLAAIKAWGKVKIEDQFAAIDGVRKYMLSGDWSNMQFIPYPATFLNGRRWEDEIGNRQECACHGRSMTAVHEPCPIHNPTRYCATCGHTGSWHKNELHHGRNPGHEFVVAIDSSNSSLTEHAI